MCGTAFEASLCTWVAAHVGRCHSADCRKESGSGFTVYGQWPIDALELTGDIASYHGPGSLQQRERFAAYGRLWPSASRLRVRRRIAAGELEAVRIGGRRANRAGLQGARRRGASRRQAFSKPAPREGNRASTRSDAMRPTADHSSWGGKLQSVKSSNAIRVVSGSAMGTVRRTVQVF